MTLIFKLAVIRPKLTLGKWSKLGSNMKISSRSDVDSVNGCFSYRQRPNPDPHRLSAATTVKGQVAKRTTTQRRQPNLNAP